jgi:putative addiction module killer protein
MINVIVYKTEMGKEPYTDFFAGIKNPIAKTAVAKAITKMRKGLPGKVESVGDGVKEHKIYIGQAYRIYFYNDGQEIIVLLGGSSKGDQKREIANAKKYLQDYKRQKKQKQFKKGV